MYWSTACELHIAELSDRDLQWRCPAVYCVYEGVRVNEGGFLHGTRWYCILGWTFVHGLGLMSDRVSCVPCVSTKLFSCL